MPLCFGSTGVPQRTPVAPRGLRREPWASGVPECPSGFRKHREPRVSLGCPPPPWGLGGLGGSRRTPETPREHQSTLPGPWGSRSVPEDSGSAEGAPQGALGFGGPGGHQRTAGAPRGHRSPPLPWASGAPECSRGHQEHRAVAARLVWPRGSRSVPEESGSFDGAPETPPWASGAPEGTRGHHEHRAVTARLVWPRGSRSAP